MSEENTTPAAETTETTTETQPESTSEKTFTQSEVNALLADNKRKIKAQFADYEELKATAAKLEEIKSEAFNSGKTTAQNELVGRLVETEIKSNASALGFADPSDALTFFGDTSDITYDAEKGLDGEAITKRLTELAETKPYLLKTESGTGAPSTSRPKPKSSAPLQPSEEGLKGAAALRQAFSKKTN